MQRISWLATICWGVFILASPLWFWLWLHYSPWGQQYLGGIHDFGFDYGMLLLFNFTGLVLLLLNLIAGYLSDPRWVLNRVSIIVLHLLNCFNYIMFPYHGAGDAMLLWLFASLLLWLTTFAFWGAYTVPAKSILRTRLF